ncbi:MAG: hypothetical protein CVU42_04185 [Chloroflexi bacterium HGW-Chloroflexi-4]|jgi:uncharacterized membrane protein|nr:MAG: hypothetical protein CVU42_04185 [Chloroflexi bacterium HGW-Chloroflexi-4]
MPQMKFSNWTNRKWVKISLLVLLLALFSIWAIETPHGVYGKLEAIGYAVCHQIASHTIEIGGKLLPLCARCTGMYLGTLLALAILKSNQRLSGKPSTAKIMVLAFFLLIFTVDGVNSMLASFFSISPLYPPSNWLRLGTGLLMGVVLANILLPLWNQTLWKESNPRPVLQSWKRFFLLLLFMIVVGVLIWLDIPMLYYPIAILSTGTVFVILGMVYTLLWSIILNKENTLEKLKDGITFYLLGVICALVQIGLMDLIRLSLTGSWSGFQI